MAIDFMTALRSRARAQERGARLSGRPLTQLEAVAPYVAMAETAGTRYATGKALELQEKGQGTQEQQFGETLEFQKAKQAEDLRLEQERLQAQKEQESARLAEMKRTTDLQVEAAREANEPSTGGQIAGTLIGGGVGAYAGATYGAEVGSFFAPPVGTIVGGVIGAIAGLFGGKKGCIIISACTGSDSYEVNLARQFRDTYLGPVTLIGYYKLASLVCPAIDKLMSVRWLVRTLLVKRLVDYGEWVMGLKNRMKRAGSEKISKGFLALCQKIGEEVIR